MAPRRLWGCFARISRRSICGHHGGCGGVSLVPLGVVPVSKSAVKFLKWWSYLRNYCDLIVKWQQCCGLTDA